MMSIDGKLKQKKKIKLKQNKRSKILIIIQAQELLHIEDYSIGEKRP